MAGNLLDQSLGSGQLHACRGNAGTNAHKGDHSQRD